MLSHALYPAHEALKLSAFVSNFWFKCAYTHLYLSFTERTERQESPPSDAAKLRAQILPHRQDLLDRIAFTKTKVFLAQVAVATANTNLEAARNCERLLTDALTRLDKELEQKQPLETPNILLESDQDIRVSDSKETSGIAIRGRVVE